MQTQPKSISANGVYAAKVIRSNGWCGHVTVEGEPPREVGCILPIGHDENVHEETIVLSVKTDGTPLIARVETREELESYERTNDDGGKRDWYCHYCGGEKPRDTMCECRSARLHTRVEILERVILGMYQNPEHTRCTETDSNGVQCEARGPHKFHNVDKALKEFLDRRRGA